MTRLDAALMEEQDARRALNRRLGELAEMIQECEMAVLRGKPLPVQHVPSKAVAVDEASRIWDATRHCVDVIRANERAA